MSWTEDACNPVGLLGPCGVATALLVGYCNRYGELTFQNDTCRFYSRLMSTL